MMLLHIIVLLNNIQLLDKMQMKCEGKEHRMRLASDKEIRSYEYRSNSRYGGLHLRRDEFYYPPYSYKVTCLGFIPEDVNVQLCIPQGLVSYYPISYHIVSYHIVSYHMISYHIDEI